MFKRNKDQYNAIESLLVTPAIDGDIGGLGQDTAINYMWSFSALRFITELERLQNDYQGYEKLVADNFSYIFSPQKSIAFSVQEAMVNLKSQLPPSRSLCFTTYKNKYYVLVISQPSGTPWTFASIDVLTANIDKQPQHRATGEYFCNATQTTNIYQVYNLPISANPEDQKYKNKKLVWRIVGDTQGMVDDCDKEILPIAHQAWINSKS